MARIGHWHDSYARRIATLAVGMAGPLFAGLLFSAAAEASDDSSARYSDHFIVERKQFKDALAALEQRDSDTFGRLSARLTGYPLYRYLEFERLKLAFSDDPTAGLEKLQAFRQQFDDSALSRKLTHNLQNALVKHERWSDYLAFAQQEPGAAKSCASLRARFELGQLKAFDDDSLELWVSPVKRPKLCAEAIAHLESVDKPGIVAYWDRIYHAVEKKQAEAVADLIQGLTASDRRIVRLWIDALDKPASLLKTDVLKDDTPLNRRIIRDLIWRWSYEEPIPATRFWIGIRNNYLFFSDKRYDLNRNLALRGAYRHMPEARDWLNNFKLRDDDLEIREWRIRAALRDSDWPAVLHHLSDLPAEEREEDHWAFWEAHALEQTGETASADTLFRELAELQSYHGFLAADRRNLPYILYEEPIDVAEEDIGFLNQHSAMIRAREYHHTGLPWEARREWSAALKTLLEEQPDKPWYEASAVLAKRWLMPDRAIFSAGKADARRALSYRFPVLFVEDVLNYSSAEELSPDVVYGIIRRESAFMADVRSGAGAIGLMQLIPSTAKQVSRMKGLKNWNGDMTDPRENIAFGTHYLRYVLDRFDGQLALGFASYNAGPHRVDKWLPVDTMKGDLWVDTIPYSETRKYVRAILAYAAIYQWRLSGGKQVTRISDRLPDVQPKAEEKLASDASEN